MFMQNRNSIIFEDYVIEILKIIKNSNNIKVNDVKNQIGSSSAKINTLITKMISENLISESKGLRYNTKYLKLTPKGEYVLKHIESILKAIESDELETLQENDHGPSEETRTEATVNE